MAWRACSTSASSPPWQPVPSLSCCVPFPGHGDKLPAGQFVLCVSAWAPSFPHPAAAAMQLHAPNEPTRACVCVCVCVCLCVCMCVNIFHNCTGEARCSATNTNSLVRASEYLRLTSTRRLIFDAHIVSEMKMKICHPQNISGASEESSTAGFSFTTEADNTYSSSGVALVHSAFCSCSKDFGVNKVFSNQFGISELLETLTSCKEPFLFIFISVVSFYFSCLAECCHSVLLWSSRNVLLTT